MKITAKTRQVRVLYFLTSRGTSPFTCVFTSKTDLRTEASSTVCMLELVYYCEDLYSTVVDRVIN